uniref:Protein pelota homolog n=1 Tax=Sinocyclocheilus rhinocerous TaxID=307959 RepID=A0A673KL60_9TELE
MKLAHKDIEKDNAGQVTLIPEEAEDMWHTYNLLHVGDSLRASTIRKVQTESSTGSVGSSRVRTTLTLCVETIDFDSQACQLRVKGTNIQENQYVKMGAYHTIELELNRKFTLAKKVWDSVVLDRIGNVLVLGLLNFTVIPVINDFTSTEVLCDPAVTARLSDTKAAGEVKALEDFYKMLQQEPDRAFYGLAHVERASEALAVDILMISDKLFRHQDIATRSRYVRLVDNVKENGGNVRIFSSLHVSGEQLNQLSGVVAILRFPIADMSEAEEESSSDED